MPSASFQDPEEAVDLVSKHQKVSHNEPKCQVL